jgi:pyrimidine operon attenuation protein/uracil phosphoribosyltransferase
LESVLDYGRPKKVELVVLVDRGHRELPIQADYIGKYIETAENEVVEVLVPSVDGEEGVFLTTLELLKAPQQREAQGGRKKKPEKS